MSTFAKPVPFGSDLRAALLAMVRKRVPESEVEDIVQQALAEAIESPHAPQESEALRRWIFGVAKNKVVDYHRRAGRESFDLPEVAGAPAPHVEADLLRWAERNLPEGDENQKTLDWMIREGEGEKLESIAESEKLPPPRVRQRVSRLRRHFKENWQREVALLAALGVIVSAIALFLTHKERPEPITHDDPQAEPVRRLALEKCANKEWKRCVDGLDEARRLDPAGDARPEVQQARQAADAALKAPPPAPSSELTPVPSTSAPFPMLDPSSFSSLSPAPSGQANVQMKSQGPLDSKTKVTPKPTPMNAKPQSTETLSQMPTPTGSASPFPPFPSKENATPAPTPTTSPPVKAAPSKKGGSKATVSPDTFGGGSSGKAADPSK